MRRLLALLLCLFLPAAALATEKAEIVRNGDRESPRIAITFDDCYDTENVARVVALCAKYQVPVTFFVVGAALRAEDQAVWLSALNAGCELGNHTFGHQDLVTIRKDELSVRKELSRTQHLLNEVLGFDYPMQVMRPPFGHVRSKSAPFVTPMLRKEGYRYAVLWDVSQIDPDQAIKQVHNGSILLFHTNIDDVRCIDQLIPALLEKGYQPVTVSDLLGLAPVATCTDLGVSFAVQ